MNKKYDWESVDWSKRTVDIAVALGTSITVVTAARKRYAPETVRRRTNVLWHTVDWHKDDDTLVNELGCLKATVIHARRLRAPETVQHKYDWNSVDWSMRDNEICRELGCSKHTVYDARRRIAPNTVVKKEPWAKFFGIDWSKSTAEISSELGGCNCSIVSRARKRFAPETLGMVKKKREATVITVAEEMRNADWTKPVTVLAKEYGHGINLLYRVRRLLGKPKVTKFAKLIETMRDTDWTKSTRDLARMYDCSTVTIIKVKKVLGIPMMRRTRKRFTHRPLTKSDVNKASACLARYNGRLYDVINSKQVYLDEYLEELCNLLSA